MEGPAKAMEHHLKGQPKGNKKRDYKPIKREDQSKGKSKGSLLEMPLTEKMLSPS